MSFNGLRILGFLAILNFSCTHSHKNSATSESSHSSPSVELQTEAKPQKQNPRSFQRSVTKYIYDEQTYDVEWASCFTGTSDSPSSVLVMHDSEQGFELNEKICDDWISSSFMEEGYHVIFVNRPGYGQSTGKRDDVGPLSIESLENMVNDFHKTYAPKKKIVGIWGYGFGSIASALLGRKVNEVDWLIMGGGIFDLDAALASTKDQSFKTKLIDIKKANAHALAIRSVTYDIEGLPKSIYLYHGQDNKVIPIDQVKLFKNTLSDLNINVHLEILNHSGHVLDIQKHQQVLKGLVAKTAEQSSETSAR